LHQKAFGNDDRETQQPFSPKVQGEIGANSSLSHRPSTTGLLGDCSLGGTLAHRSHSWRLANKRNAGALDTNDIEGAQPGEPNKFLQATNRHTNSMAPAYKLPTSPPRTPLLPKASGRDSLRTSDIALESDPRNLFGTGWTAERRDRFMNLNRDKQAGLEGNSRPPGSAAHSVPDALEDVAGSKAGTTYRFRMMKQFGRDDRDPQGSDLMAITRGR
jgi:hypothetical protein